MSSMCVPLTGCQAKLHFCDSNPCKSNGICSERWGGFSCDCPVGFGGKDCRLSEWATLGRRGLQGNFSSTGGACDLTPFISSAMAHPYHFRGNGTLRWDFGNDLAVSVPWYLGLAFRTRATQGVLMQVQAGPHSTLLCQVCLSSRPVPRPSVLSR